MNSAEVWPLCDVCAAIDSTDAKRFFSRCCISPAIRRLRSAAAWRSRAKPASRAQAASISSGHGAGASVVNAMKKLPKARSSADFTGRDLMQRTP